MDKRASNAAVIRVHKNKNYTVMSNNHLLGKPPLSLKAKGLLSVCLALPDDWSYSINGLVAICKEGRDGVRSAIDELKENGYLKIEQTNSAKGRFKTVYHIFENKQSDVLPCTAFPYTVKPSTVLPSTVNPLQLNTKKLNTKKPITNNEVLESASTFGANDLFNLYKEICIESPQPKELTSERKEKAEKRISKHPEREYWETVFKNAANSSFCLKNSFFSFDWILKNDGNALKVYEGNYGDKNVVQINTGAVNSNKYANYHKKQEAEALNG